MTFSVHGFIVDKEDWREYDRTFTLYTKEYGKIVVLAQGVRKINSKLCGNLEPLSEVVCMIARGRSINRIASVEMRDRFLVIKEQLEKCAIAFFFFDVINQLIKEDMRDDALFRLLQDFFSSLQDAKAGKAYTIGIAALVKLSCILGHQPYSKGITQSLMRSQSLLAFSRGRTKADYHNLSARMTAFLENMCDRPLRSKDFFDFYASGALS
ncbi:MAG: DNA repair protein RecO [Patescibacteria group bacterium]